MAVAALLGHYVLPAPAKQDLLANQKFYRGCCCLLNWPLSLKHG